MEGSGGGGGGGRERERKKTTNEIKQIYRLCRLNCFGKGFDTINLKPTNKIR